MITLATLPQATEQEVFDQAAKHLLTQNTKSTVGDVNCRYRGENGLMCAAGCFISDDEYDPEMEGEIWQELILAPNKHKELINDLQIIHDDCLVEDWESELVDLAKGYDLIFNKI